MDGIKIQTSANSSYYLQYRTWNQGKTSFYPYVSSKINDYAGSSGKPMQLLQIQAYKNDGTKLSTGIVVMYRVKVDGAWLSWVSNADPDWMRNVQSKYNLGGTLDTSGSYAGISGKNISGVEIRVFEEESISTSTGYSGGQTDTNLSYMVDNTSNWTSFENSTNIDHLDGIKIQTSTNKSYYLGYKTWNAGQSGFYPEVKSTVNDYAGLPGKPIQLLNIRAYSSDGTSLTSGIVVMYRAYVEGRWLAWVSNAAPQYMQSVQSKYNLGGSLDTSGSYAGINGKNISGIEILVFEEDGTGAASSFTGMEATASMTYMFDSNTNWNSFNNTVTASHIDGIKIQTDTNKSYYIGYKTWNAGKSGFYPEVKSTVNDYAGSPGKSIQKLSIRAYRNDGTKLVSGVVVMYRVLVDGRWLPWVSNADPQYMQSAQSQYNLGGTLDISGYYAGISGKNISGIEIHIFEGDIPASSVGNLSGNEDAPSLSYVANSSTNWNTFIGSVLTYPIDGIKIQTNPNKPYYLQYKTWNAGRTSYYPPVSSRVNDYAGSVGKPIQKLNIRAYANDGTSLVSGVVVMYRVYVEGRWLPWVSNANPEYMQSVYVKYNLGGTLDKSGAYAGIDGKNISGVEIRVFEENGIGTTPNPTGNYKIIQAPHIYQMEHWKTGCESVSTVMAMNYVGINISVDTFIDNYLYKTGKPFDPNISFGGDPTEPSGVGCYSPVIKKALDKALVGKGYYAKVLNNVSLQELCTQYIDNNIPVILWATMRMDTPRTTTWKYDNRTITWVQPEHCLLLVGYDSTER